MSRDSRVQINPTLLVRVQYRVSVPGKGTVTGSFAAEREPELARALATVGGPAGQIPMGFDDSILERLMSLGAVTTPDTTPEEVHYASVLPAAHHGDTEHAETTAPFGNDVRCRVGSLNSAPVRTSELRSIAPTSDPEHPILWVQARSTGLWFPYWTDSETAARMAAVAAHAGPAPERGSAPDEAPAMESWQAAFATDGLVVLPGLLPTLQIEILRQYTARLYQQGYFLRDGQQVEGREFIHNEPLMGFFNRQLARLVSRIAGEPAKPSYTYLARYNGGSELKRHVDRSQCRWNISLVLDETPRRDAAWPLYVELCGVPREVRLNPGDAVLFHGSTHPHWRPRLAEDSTAVIAFFHFVAEGFEGSLD